jgi:acid phosphatase family membrane protein YuiD
MKAFFLAATFAIVPGLALAQSMTCADYMKMNQQVSAQMGKMPSSGDAKLDAQAAALDKKVSDYCAKNPSVSVEKAMTEAAK